MRNARPEPTRTRLRPPVDGVATRARWGGASRLLMGLGLLAAGCEARPVDIVARPRTVLDAASGDGGAEPDRCATRWADDNLGPALRASNASATAHAICTCEDYSGAAGLRVQAFSRDGGVGGTVLPGASVGVNGRMSQTGDTQVAGSLTIAGSGGLSLGMQTRLSVGGDLGITGPLEGTGARVAVDGDAQVGGRVQLAELLVDGRFTQPAGSSLEVTGGAPPARVEGEVVVAPPCDCPQAFPDLQSLAADATVLTEGTLAQTCGSYRVEGGQLEQLLPLHVEQPAQVLVEGDLALSGDLAVDLAAGADLDLLVTGNVRVDGALQVEPMDGAARVRIYVAGGGTIEVGGGGQLHAELYAPLAELVSPAPLTVVGSVFVRRMAAAGALTVQKPLDPAP